MHILISTDGSEVAQKGVDHGLTLAKALGAKVTIVTVSEPFPVYSGSGGWSLGPDETASYTAAQAVVSDRILSATKAAADKLGVECETLHVANAFPADGILDTAQTKHCSLIVMSSHGRRGFKRILLGSQTAEVLARTPVPVLVVR